MSKRPDLYRKALDSPQNLTFREVCTLAKSVGYKSRSRIRSGSSHQIFKHPSIRGILNFQSDHGKAIPYQIKQLLEKIDEYNLMQEK